MAGYAARLNKCFETSNLLISERRQLASDELVEVTSEGAVTSWSWVSEPRAQQPLEHPFAYALVQLDGADTPFLHVVDSGSESAMKTGMRVRARWADETQGAITDFNEAIRLDSEFEVSFELRGRCLFEMQRYEEAIEDFSRCLELDEVLSNLVF